MNRYTLTEDTNPLCANNNKYSKISGQVKGEMPLLLAYSSNIDHFLEKNPSVSCENRLKPSTLECMFEASTVVCSHECQHNSWCHWPKSCFPAFISFPESFMVSTWISLVKDLDSFRSLSRCWDNFHRNNYIFPGQLGNLRFEHLQLLKTGACIRVLPLPVTYLHPHGNEGGQ